MKKYFITGTDTDVGKTLTSAILTLALEGAYWKPIQSGIGHHESDFDLIKSWTGLSEKSFFPSNYSFKECLSPHIAATLENVEVDMSKCVLPETTKPLIVEGAGGAFVPVNNKQSVMDLMIQLGIPAIIVSRGTLGTLNHTLLTIEALRKRDIEIHGVIFSGDLYPNNQETIEKWGNVKTLLHIPKFETLEAAQIQKWTAYNKEKICRALL